MLSRSELIDRMCAIAGEIESMDNQRVLTAADEQRFEALSRWFDQYDFARIAVEVGVAQENVPGVVALLAG
jgi:hypothetical protein